MAVFGWRKLEGYQCQCGENMIKIKNQCRDSGKSQCAEPMCHFTIFNANFGHFPSFNAYKFGCSPCAPPDELSPHPG